MDEAVDKKPAHRGIVVAGTGIMPRQFLDEFAHPGIAEWRADPFNVRLATIALCQLDILAERVSTPRQALLGNPLMQNETASVVCGRWSGSRVMCTTPTSTDH